MSGDRLDLLDWRRHVVDLYAEVRVAPVAVDKPALVGEAGLDRLDGGQDARIVTRQEPDHRQHQHGGIEFVAAEGVRERADGLAPPVGEDGRADSCAVDFQPSTRSSAANACARSIAQDSATQHITLE